MFHLKLFTLLKEIEKNIVLIRQLYAFSLTKSLYQRALMRKITQLAESLTYLKSHSLQNSLIQDILLQLEENNLIHDFIKLRNFFFYKYPYQHHIQKKETFLEESFKFVRENLDKLEKKLALFSNLKVNVEVMQQIGETPSATMPSVEKLLSNAQLAQAEILEFKLFLEENGLKLKMLSKKKFEIAFLKEAIESYCLNSLNFLRAYNTEYETLQINKPYEHLINLLLNIEENLEIETRDFLLNAHQLRKSFAHGTASADLVLPVSKEHIKHFLAIESVYLKKVIETLKSLPQEQLNPISSVSSAPIQTGSADSVSFSTLLYNNPWAVLYSLMSNLNEHSFLQKDESHFLLLFPQYELCDMYRQALWQIELSGNQQAQLREIESFFRADPTANSNNATIQYHAITLSYEEYQNIYSALFNVSATETENQPSDKPLEQSFHWYTEDEMIILLKVFLEHLNLVNVIAQTQFEHQNLFEDNIKQAIIHVLKTKQSVVIPLHINENHWVSFILKEKKSNIQIIYNDSKGTKLEHTDKALKLVKQITAIEKDAEIIDLSFKQQVNDDDCGPFTVEDLIQLAKHDTSHLSLPEIQKLLPQPLKGDASELRKKHQIIFTAHSNLKSLIVPKPKTEKFSFTYSFEKEEEAKKFQTYLNTLNVISHSKEIQVQQPSMEQLKTLYILSLTEEQKKKYDALMNIQIQADPHISATANLFFASKKSISTSALINKQNYYSWMNEALSQFNSKALPETWVNENHMIFYLQTKLKQNKDICVPSQVWNLESSIEKEAFPLHDFITLFCVDSFKKKFIVPILDKGHFYGLVITKNESGFLLEYFDPADSADSTTQQATDMLLKINQLEVLIKKMIFNLCSLKENVPYSISKNRGEITAETIQMIKKLYPKIPIVDIKNVSMKQQFLNNDCGYIVAQTLYEKALEQPLSIQSFDFQNPKKSVQMIAKARHEFYNPQLLGLKNVEQFERAAWIERLKQSFTNAKSLTLLKNFILTNHSFYPEMLTAIKQVLKSPTFEAQPEIDLHKCLMAFNLDLIKKFISELLEPEIDEHGIVQFKLNSQLAAKQEITKEEKPFLKFT